MHPIPICAMDLWCSIQPLAQLPEKVQNVRLPGKQVLAETADKQKAVPKEADLASNGTVFYVVKIISELEYVVNL